MNKTMNGHYENAAQARNTHEDLVATGIPQDKVYVDEENQTIKVIIPAEEEREIQEIFDRHNIEY